MRKIVAKIAKKSQIKAKNFQFPSIFIIICSFFAWNLNDIVEYVTNDDSQVSFSNYARNFIGKIDKLCLGIE